VSDAAIVPMAALSPPGIAPEPFAPVPPVTALLLGIGPPQVSGLDSSVALVLRDAAQPGEDKRGKRALALEMCALLEQAHPLLRSWVPPEHVLRRDVRPRPAEGPLHRLVQTLAPHQRLAFIAGVADDWPRRGDQLLDLFSGTAGTAWKAAVSLAGNGIGLSIGDDLDRSVPEREGAHALAGQARQWVEASCPGVSALVAHAAGLRATSEGAAGASAPLREMLDALPQQAVRQLLNQWARYRNGRRGDIGVSDDLMLMSCTDDPATAARAVVALAACAAEDPSDDPVLSIACELGGGQRAIAWQLTNKHDAIRWTQAAEAWGLLLEHSPVHRILALRAPALRDIGTPAGHAGTLRQMVDGVATPLSRRRFVHRLLRQWGEIRDHVFAIDPRHARQDRESIDRLLRKASADARVSAIVNGLIAQASSDRAKSDNCAQVLLWLGSADQHGMRTSDDLGKMIRETGFDRAPVVADLRARVIGLVRHRREGIATRAVERLMMKLSHADA
jgi:hypothetical protein